MLKAPLMALKAQIDTNTVRDLNIPLLPIGQLSRQKISKETSELLYTVDQIDMDDIYRVLHSTTRQYTFFSAAHRTLSKINHILGHKASLKIFKKIETTPYIISDHNRIKLDTNDKRNLRKYSNTWRLNITLLKNQWVAKLIREEIKEFLESSENGNIIYQNLWDTAKVMLRGEFTAISAYTKKTETSQINNLMMHLKLLEKQEQTKLETNRRRAIIKIRVKKNEIETKETVQRINETKLVL
jgi:hypothetical protein